MQEAVQLVINLNAAATLKDVAQLNSRRLPDLFSFVFGDAVEDVVQEDGTVIEARGGRRSSPINKVE